VHDIARVFEVLPAVSLELFANLADQLSKIDAHGELLNENSGSNGATGETTSTT